MATNCERHSRGRFLNVSKDLQGFSVSSLGSRKVSLKESHSHRGSIEPVWNPHQFSFSETQSARNMNNHIHFALITIYLPMTGLAFYRFATSYVVTYTHRHDDNATHLWVYLCRRSSVCKASASVDKCQESWTYRRLLHTIRSVYISSPARHNTSWLRR